MQLSRFLEDIADVPDPLVDPSGSSIDTLDAWQAVRGDRLRTVLDAVYGQPPVPAAIVATECADGMLPGLDGRIHLVRIALEQYPEQPIKLNLAIRDGHAPRPTAIVTQNLRGFMGAAVHPFTPVAFERGYNLATFDTWDVQPDRPGTNGWRQCFPDATWGTLACWAWSISRVIDYLVTRPDVDAQAILVSGHSRRGKTAILAAAMDERIACCAPNASGLFGLDLTRGHYHPDCDRQRIPAVFDEFPHWFGPNAECHRHAVESMPFDQHWLVSLIAPRPFFSTQAADDEYTWVPAAEATLAMAQPTYDLYSRNNAIRMHVRPGRHAHTPEEFAQVLDDFRTYRALTIP